MEKNEFELNIMKLNWHSSEAVQNEAISNLCNIDQEEVKLLISKSDKFCWHNAMIVLQKIGYPKNKLAIPSMIWLFQDTNWPGVKIALDVLKNINTQEVIPCIEEALIEARDTGDYMWIGGIQRLVEELGLSRSDFSNNVIYDLLKLADW